MDKLNPKNFELATPITSDNLPYNVLTIGGSLGPKLIHPVLHILIPLSSLAPPVPLPPTSADFKSTPLAFSDQFINSSHSSLEKTGLSRSILEVSTTNVCTSILVLGRIVNIRLLVLKLYDKSH